MKKQKRLITKDGDLFQVNKLFFAIPILNINDLHQNPLPNDLLLTKLKLPPFAPPRFRGQLKI